MSVYTELSLDELRAFAADHYGLAVAGCTPIASGIENTNYFLRLDDGRELVLTLFEELDAAGAAFLPPLLQHLDRQGVPVAGPLVARDGRSLLTLRDKPVQLAPRIAGGHPAPVTPAQCAAIGAALAKMHLALAGYPLQRENAHGADWWEAEARKARKGLSSANQLLLDTVLEDFEETVEDFDDLPTGLIHGDLFRDNTLFEGDTLRAILDFSEAGEDYWLLDVAITANDFCSAWPDVTLDQGLFGAFLEAYESVRPLTEDEQVAMPAFLAMAATRFWLSRLAVAARNAAEGRDGEAITRKDPDDMRRMVAARMLGD